jgi:hypothetical protein
MSERQPLTGGSAKTKENELRLQQMQRFVYMVTFTVSA